MEALGMIETRGLIAAIESADAMLKAADVTLLERTFVKGGIVTITVTGEVAAVKASVDAGAAAVQMLGGELLRTCHVIPRPHEDLENNVIAFKPLSDKNSEEKNVSEPVLKKNEKVVESDTSQQKIEKEKDIVKNTEVQLKITSKEDLDNLINEVGIDKALEALTKCKVTGLRDLARKFENFGIVGREISSANKEILIMEFTKYYK